MGAKHFGDLTHWDKSHADGNHGEAAGGWYRPGENYFISPQDPCWNRVLDQARSAYGDPGIRYDTDNPWQERHLVFGDGSRLPSDGAVVYHDAATRRSWVQNDDGTVSLVGPDGNPGAPLTPVGYRKVGDRYAPVDGRGDQIGPQLGGVPSSDNGFHTDPQSGALTPKNSNGDYYTLGPDGRKSFFDKTGAPITEDQFGHSSAPRDGAQPPAAAGLPTAEQLSGQAAEAVKKLHQQLKDRYSALSDAEEKLSDVLLNAYATTTAGQKKLHDIQGALVSAVDNPALAMDTAAGERALLTLLRNQVGDINDLLTSGSLRAEDQRKAIAALSALYTADTGAATPADPSPPGSGPPAAAGGTPDADLPADAGAAGADVGLDPAPQVADPGLADLSGGALPVAADSLSPLTSMLPAAGGLGSGVGASPLDGLSPLLGAAGPLSGGDGQPGEHSRRDRSGDDDDSTEPAKGKAAKTDTAGDDAAVASGGGPQPGGDTETPAGQPPVPAVAPVAASTTVTLPDGSTSVARNPQAAQAIRDYLAGDTVDASYRKNGIALPPPGTALTHPLDPSRLACGDLAMFKDHYVPVLSAVKAYLNGQVVPLGSVTSSPDFLGWIDPSAAAGVGVGSPAVSAAPGAGPAAGSPAPTAGLPAAVPGG